MISLTNSFNCNILAIKVALFLLFFVSLIGIACLGKAFYPKNGWMAALFSFLSPNLFFEATKFENDQFATPLLIFACYFFYKARLTGQEKYDIYTLCLLIVAAGFWQGAIYFLIAFALSSLALLLPALAVTFYSYKKLVASTIPITSVVESQALAGIAMIGGLAIGYAKLPKQMWPQVALFTLLAALQVKFAWFLVPLLSVGVLAFYNSEKVDRKAIGKSFKGVLLSAAVVLVVAWGVVTVMHPPHEYQWQAVEFAIQEANGGMVQNDWNLGYFIFYKGGTPLQWGGGKQMAFGKGIVVTRQHLECEVLETFQDLNVWKC